MTKEILLPQGRIVLVDDDDFEKVSSYRWRLCGKGPNKYAITNSPRKLGVRTGILMHRMLMGAEKGDGKFVDHINGNGLDNRRENLRFATLSQNQANTHVVKSASGYKGVFKHCKGNWEARIGYSYAGKKKYKSLGVFKDKREAAIAYNTAALVLYGEYAKLNDT